MSISLQEKKHRLIKRYFILLSGIFLLGFLLRLIHIDANSFWTDEGLTPLRSSYPLLQILRNDVIIQGRVTKDTHPAFFYLIIHFTRLLFGESDFAYRYPSALANMMLVAVMFRFGKRLHSVKLGLVAAFLMTINPLHIWYANEARMYAIYSLLVAGASYLLWQAIVLEQSNTLSGRQTFVWVIRQRRLPQFYRYLLGYLLLAGLALYTHYTAVFLIAAQSLFWAWLFWKRGQLRDLLIIVGLGLVAALPLVPYTIPRLTSGAEANFFYVPPVIMLQDVFRFFYLGDTLTLNQTSIYWMTTLAVLVTAVGLWAAKTRPTQLFLLTYLFAVVIGLMIGQTIKPMYQGARHIMVGSPAFILLISWALIWLWQKIQTKKHPLLITAYLSFLILLFYGPTRALINYYTNPTLAKDDYRSMVAFLDEVAGRNDVVVYNNAVLLPTHAHYTTREDTAVTATPSYLNQATIVSSAELAHLNTIFEHIWFITEPPADGRDETQITQQWLDDNLGTMETYPFHARTTVLNVIAYRTDNPYQENLPPLGVPIDQKWDGFPHLAGMQLVPPPAEGKAAWIDLYWHTADADFNDQTAQVRFAVMGPNQREWLVLNQVLQPENGRLNWQDERLIRTSYTLPLPEGMPAGSYSFTIQPLDADEQPIDAPILAASLELEHPIPTAESTPILKFENGVTLTDFRLADLKVRPGHNLPVSLFWELSEQTVSPESLVYELTVVNKNGDPLRQDENKVGPDWLVEWPRETAVRENNSIYIYPEAVPGDYDIQLRLRQDDTYLQNQSWNPFAQNDKPIIVGQFTVEPWPHLTTLPEISQPINAQFGSAINLAGVDIIEEDAFLDLTFYWQTLAQPDNNYLIFIHLVNENGDIVSQIDQVPVNGLRPTGGWRPIEMLIDSYQLGLPSDLPSGSYSLRVGFFIPESFVRMPVALNGVAQPNDQLVITTIEITD